MPSIPARLSRFLERRGEGIRGCKSVLGRVGEGRRAHRIHSPGDFLRELLDGCGSSGGGDLTRPGGVGTGDAPEGL